MGNERARTYLRLVAEAQLRKALRAPRVTRASRLVIEENVRQVRWAGDILAAAGALDDEDVALIVAELETALAVRSGMDTQQLARRLGWIAAPTGESPQRQHAAQLTQIAPIGQVVGVGNDRAPSDLHLMALASTPTDTVLTAAMRMRWPTDGSSADLEITGAGPQHLPYDQLWAADDKGGRYSVGFDGDGGTTVWHGIVRLSPALSLDARWLELIANGAHRLIRLRLPPAGKPVPAGTVISGSVTASPAERWLTAQASRILTHAWDVAGSVAEMRLGETVRMLVDAGALVADSKIPGQLAAFCEQLGLTEHGIAAPAAAALPVSWANVVGQDRRREAASRRDGVSSLAGPGCEQFAPLATVLPDIDGTRFGLVSLASAADNSYLHVVASGLPELVGRLPDDWDIRFSWWLRDSAGNWHAAIAGEQTMLSPGVTAFRLRLIPPLARPPEEIEVIVTGSSIRVRAILRCPAYPEMPDT